MDNLSPNFTLEELVYSNTANSKGISNIPNAEVKANLIVLAQNLELVRSLLNTPILISSGYRSPELNKAVKGAASSQHVLGQAVDFTSPKFGTPRQIIEKIKGSNIEYDQLILEFDKWVHISFTNKTNRKQALVIDLNGTRIFS